MATKECAYCGKLFDTDKGRKYCSPECRKEGGKKSHREIFHTKVGDELICPCCGKAFIKEKYAQKYCSKKCQRKAVNHNTYLRMKAREQGIPIKEIEKKPKLQSMGLNERLKSIEGMSYAEWQKAQTLKGLPKIII